MPGRDRHDPVSPEIGGAEPAVRGRSVPTARLVREVCCQTLSPSSCI